MRDLHVVLQAGRLVYQYRGPDTDSSAPEIFQKEFHPTYVSDGVLRLATLRGVRGNVSGIRDAGLHLHNHLVPSDLAQRLSANLDFSPHTSSGCPSLVFYLDPALSWIPWELLFDGKAFLCERFNLSRQLVEKSGSEMRNARRRL